MARLNISFDDGSDDDLPSLAQILRGTPNKASRKQGAANADECYQDKLPKSNHVVVNSTKGASRGTKSCSPVDEQSPKQRCKGVLKLAHINMLPFPSNGTSSFVRKPCQSNDSNKSTGRLWPNPERAANKHVRYNGIAARRAAGSLSAPDDDEIFTDLSGFIVPDSASEGDERKWKPGRKERQKSPRKALHSGQTIQKKQIRDTLDERKSSRPSEVTDPPLEQEKCSDKGPPCCPSKIAYAARDYDTSTQAFDLDEPFSLLRFSPPRSRKPSRIEESERPNTPPPSTDPSISRLESPSKKFRIPPSPHRPSIDAFWSQDVINNWNDEYSPKKAPRTPRHTRLLTLDEDDEDNVSSSASPHKSASKSPTKKDRQATKAFNAKKSSLATAFLADLDDKVTKSQVSSLAASTGGINIVWSKKLSSTAGRANWRREAIRHKDVDSVYPAPTYRHHASIELAEKVIDSEDRLINVLAHEYCHLANFMISGVKDQPHGKEFKTWAAKVTRAFRHRGIEVTTKHGYDITYKYIWSCGECGLEYKRHSKSIDPSKHSCGACKGRLVQVLPAPRKESEYQRFVKANWETFKKRAGDGAGWGEINGLLAKEWEMTKVGRERKAKVTVEVAEVAEDDDNNNNDNNDDDDEGNAERAESPELDNVARKLDFLKLG